MRHAQARRGRLALFFATVLLVVSDAEARTSAESGAAYDAGSPTLSDIWVDPVRGNDRNTGSARSQALSTITEAWNRIPARATLSRTGYRILLVAGDYAEASLPGYMESRYGTYNFPVIVEAADGPLTARLHAYLNIFDSRYLYLIGLDVVTDRGYGGGGNVVHLERGDHILIRNCRLNGFDGVENQPQETLKINQSQFVYVENSDIGGAFWFALDYVSVQYGHVTGSRIHNSGDDGVVLKGGTAYIRVEANEVYDCGVIGIAAGQGTGFEFMVSPWLHYEASDLKIVNNVVHDTGNAGLAVRGGYNILFAHNTLYRIGVDTGRGGPLLLVSPGGRSCDGAAAACASQNALGGWGPTRVAESEETIPNRNVYVYNNIFYNPRPAEAPSHFTVFGPRTPAAQTNIPSPALSDTNLRIRGNLIWNGAASQPLGIEDSDQGCQPANATCHATQLRLDNTINAVEPQLRAPADRDFHPVAGGSVLGAATFAIPDFAGNDRPQPPLAPAGDLRNTVAADYDGVARAGVSPPGAFASSSSVPGAPRDLAYSAGVSSVSLVWNPPASGSTVVSYVVEAGTASGLSDLARVDTGTATTTFQASSVGAGTYYVRVRAKGASGTGPPSNEVVITLGFACSPGVPGAPSGLVASVAGTTITLVWMPPGSGTPTAYLVEAGSAAGLSNLAAVEVGGGMPLLVNSNVARGTYYIRVRARNACGTGAPSNEVTAAVGNEGADEPALDLGYVSDSERRGLQAIADRSAGATVTLIRYLDRCQ